MKRAIGPTAAARRRRARTRKAPCARVSVARGCECARDAGGRGRNIDPAQPGAGPAPNRRSRLDSTERRSCSVQPAKTANAGAIYVVDCASCRARAATHRTRWISSPAIVRRRGRHIRRYAGRDGDRPEPGVAYVFAVRQWLDRTGETDAERRIDRRALRRVGVAIR